MDDQQITMTISGRLHKDLRSAMGMRALAGTGGGIVDAFVNKILSSLEEGEPTVELRYKDSERNK